MWIEGLDADVERAQQIRVRIVRELPADLVQVRPAQALEGVGPNGRAQAHHGADHRQCQRQVTAFLRDVVGDRRQVRWRFSSPVGQERPRLLGRQHVEANLLGPEAHEDLAITRRHQEPAGGADDIERRGMLEPPDVVQHEQHAALREHALQDALAAGDGCQDGVAHAERAGEVLQQAHEIGILSDLDPHNAASECRLDLRITAGGDR